jgi:hypothetical protein
MYLTLSYDTLGKAIIKFYKTPLEQVIEEAKKQSEFLGKNVRVCEVIGEATLKSEWQEEPKDE